MPRKKPTKPTDAELSILRILWRRGPSTVRDVLDELAPNTGYTSALKIMQIMHEKGLVSREENGRSHLYSAVEAAEKTQKNMLHDLIERVFEGSTTKLVMQALSMKKASATELLEIRKLIQEMERKGKP